MFEILGLTFHLYGLLIGLGVWLGFEVALRACRGKLKRQILEGAFLRMVVFGVVGARLYHVADYWQRYYSHNLVNIFYIWEGGLGIWGAIAGSILGLMIYCWKKRKNVFELLDVLVVGAPLAQAIGRLGNWANGELYGKNGEPLFAYEAGLNIMLFFFLYWQSRRQKGRGGETGYYLMGYGLIRILLEGLRPEEIIWKVGGWPMAVISGAISVVIGAWLIKTSRR